MKSCSKNFEVRKMWPNPQIVSSSYSCSSHHKALLLGIFSAVLSWQFSMILQLKIQFSSWKFEFKSKNAAHMWMAFKLQLFHVPHPTREIFTDFLTNFPETFWAKIFLSLISLKKANLPPRFLCFRKKFSRRKRNIELNRNRN